MYIPTSDRNKTVLLQKSVAYRAKRESMAVAIRWWLLMLFILVYLLFFLPSAQYRSFVFFSLLPASLALWFGVLTLIGNNGTRKIYDPVSLFNFGLFYYSLKGVALSWGDRTSFLSHISMAQIEEIYPVVAFATAGAIIAWNFGYSLVFRRESQAQSLSRTDQGATNIGQNKNLLKPRMGVASLVLFGAFSFYFLIQSVGGDPFTFLLNSWRRGYLSDTNLSGSVSAFSSLLLPGISLLPLASFIWLAILGANGKRPNIAFWIYTGLAFVALFLIMPRASIIGSLLSFLFLYHYTFRPIKLSLVATLGIFVLIYSYAVNVWRGFAWSTSNIQEAFLMLFDEFSLTGLPDFIISGAISDIRTFVLIVNHYGNELPLQYGTTLLRIFTQFVPRALWPTKPIDLGVELGRLSNPLTISGTPAGFLPEMYMNFHIVGVMLGAFVMGILMSYIYRHWVLNNPNRVLPLVLYAITIPRILLLPSNTISLAVVAWSIPVGAAVVAFWLISMDNDKRRRLA